MVEKAYKNSKIIGFFDHLLRTLKIILSKTYSRVSEIFGVLPFFDALYKMALLFFKNSLRVKNQVFASIYRLIQKSWKYFYTKRDDLWSNLQKTVFENLLSLLRYRIFLSARLCWDTQYFNFCDFLFLVKQPRNSAKVSP